VESSYPFVPDQIYQQLEVCMRMGLLEMRHIESAGVNALTPSGYLDSEKQQDKFTAAYFTAANLVRARLKELSEI
jgi:hypothetical protein